MEHGQEGKKGWQYPVGKFCVSARRVEKSFIFTDLGIYKGIIGIVLKSAGSSKLLSLAPNVENR